MTQYDSNYTLSESVFVNPDRYKISNNAETTKASETPANPLNIDNDEYDSLTSEGKAYYIKDFLEQEDEFLGEMKNPMAVISGILGVWHNESALKRSVTNKMEEKKWTGDDSYKVGRGIAQWSLGRNKTYCRWSGGKYANEDTIDNQLKFALLEAAGRPALMQALSEAETPEQAADAWRRGFENGSKNALASAKYMDSYEKVGSPGAKAIYAKDTKKANYFYDLFTGNGLIESTNNKIKQYGYLWG